MKENSFRSLNIKDHPINKILLLRNTHNLVCSYGEECQVEIFSLNFENLEKKQKYNSLQIILDPNYNSIEYLLETKINSNNKNYLLLCSDMIHVFYLYNNDTKSILLQSINEFNFRFIYQVIELRNGNLISYSNEYNISIFNNLLIENNDHIDDIDYLNKNKDYGKEIYELTQDKINKKNEIILYLLELYPNRFSYCYKKDDGEFTRFLTNNMSEEEESEENEDDSRNDDYIFIKFIDEEYNIIKEMKVSEVNKDIYNMFQYNENLMVFINRNYLMIIDLKYYEVISRIKTDRIFFSYFFSNTLIKNNFINYLLLITNDIDESISSEDENENNNNQSNEEDENSNNINGLNSENNSNSSFEEDKNKINFFAMRNLIDGIKIINCFNIHDKKIEINNIINPENVIEVSIINDSKNKNLYYFALLNKDFSILFSNLKIND